MCHHLVLDVRNQVGIWERCLFLGEWVVGAREETILMLSFIKVKISPEGRNEKSWQKEKV